MSVLVSVMHLTHISGKSLVTTVAGAMVADVVCSTMTSLAGSVEFAVEIGKSGHLVKLYDSGGNSFTCGSYYVC